MKKQTKRKEFAMKTNRLIYMGGVLVELRDDLVCKLLEPHFNPVSREEISELVRSAPTNPDGTRDWSAVSAAYRRDLVYQASRNRARANYLNAIISDMATRGLPLPSEYSRWLAVYLHNSEPTFIPKAKGRPKNDSLDMWDKIFSLAHELAKCKKNGITGIEPALHEAATHLFMSFESTKALYYSPEYQELEKVGAFKDVDLL